MHQLPPFAALAGAVFCSCISEADNPYAPRPAFFRFSPVTAAPHSLLPALTNPGEWCTVTKSTGNYTFHSLTTGKTDTYPLTAIDNYGSPTWVSGLIVGTPLSPDMDGRFLPMVFDLVCPACFEEGGITRAVGIESVVPTRARCSRCNTLYDLDNGGIVINASDAPSRRLYRYRCAYDNNTLVVSN